MLMRAQRNHIETVARSVMSRRKKQHGDTKHRNVTLQTETNLFFLTKKQILPKQNKLCKTPDRVPGNRHPL